jgi:hypothetical protein
MSTADVLEEMLILRRWAYRTLASDSDEVEKELDAPMDTARIRARARNETASKKLSTLSVASST